MQYLCQLRLWAVDAWRKDRPSFTFAYEGFPLAFEPERHDVIDNRMLLYIFESATF